jgi:hypothetical protein
MREKNLPMYSEERHVFITYFAKYLSLLGFHFFSSLSKIVTWEQEETGVLITLILQVLKVV